MINLAIRIGHNSHYFDPQKDRNAIYDSLTDRLGWSHEDAEEAVSQTEGSYYEEVAPDEPIDIFCCAAIGCQIWLTEAITGSMWPLSYSPRHSGALPLGKKYRISIRTAPVMSISVIIWALTTKRTRSVNHGAELEDFRSCRRAGKLFPNKVTYESYIAGVLRTTLNQCNSLTVLIIRRYNPQNAFLWAGSRS